MQDAKGLETEILKLKKPEHDNLIALAKDYHNAVCNGDKCIIYEKKLPLFKVGFELVGGQIYINDVFFCKYNLFLKVGVLYPVTKLEFKLNDALLTPSAEFPFQIEYVYPHGIFRPKFAIGTNFPYISLDLSPGVDIRLAKWLFLTVNYNAGLYPGNYGAPFQLRVFSQSISTGLLLKL
jgi:hypothetical protein